MASVHNMHINLPKFEELEYGNRPSPDPLEYLAILEGVGDMLQQFVVRACL